MLSPPLNRNEEQRLQALERYGILDTPPEREYDDIVELAAESCGVPAALITLVDRHRQWFKANVGLPGVTETERCVSFCTHTIQQEDVLLVEDTHLDARFTDNPLVRNAPFIRFYAGVPLRTEDGFQLGTLCVIDTQPRTLTSLQLRTLKGLARQVEVQLHLRLQLKLAQAHNSELQVARKRLHSLFDSLQDEVRERQRAERELRSQQELLSSILSHIPHAVFWKDRDSVFLGCNSQFARDMGLASPADVIGKTDQELGSCPERAAAYREDDRQVMESGVPKLSFEEPQPGRNGEGGWVLTSKVPLRDADGSVCGVLGIYADITERRRQEAALQDAKHLIELHAAHLEMQVQEARERTQQLMVASTDAVFLLDELGHILEANPEAERLMGIKSIQMLGMPFEILAPEAEREPLRQALRQLRYQGAARLENQALRSITRGRMVFDFVASLQVAGPARQLLLVGHDLTEQRRLEHQGIQNDRLASMGALAAGIAHEINNPTSYVLSNLGFLKSWQDELEQELGAAAHTPRVQEMLTEAREVVAECLDGCSRIRDIVRDMRCFSHTPDENVMPVDIHASLDVVLRMAHGELKHTARLEKDYAPQLPVVLGSEGRLSQVFLNLVINAAHAMRSETPSEHVLRVRTRLEGERVRIDVSDTGHGIPPDVLSRIFDPFFTTKPTGVGTGLGLSISHSIVQKMGGEITVESEVGRGTTFTLRLPACLPKHSDPERPEPEDRVLAS
jgi:PAS domain S-box-containing protein